jgi:hypothetical protein
MNLNRLTRPKYLVAELHPALRDEVLFDVTNFSTALLNAGISVDSQFPLSTSGESNTFWLGLAALNWGEYDTGTQTLNQIHAWPFVIGKTCRVAAMRWWVSAVGAPGSKFRFGLYARDTTRPAGHFPGPLLYDTGEQAGDTLAGAYTIHSCVSPVTLAGGVYFWSLLQGTSSPTWSRIHPAYLNDLLSNARVAPVSRSAALAYGAFPDTFPTNVAEGGDLPPRIWLMVTA